MIPVIESKPLHTVYLRGMQKEVKFHPYNVRDESGFVTAVSEGTAMDILLNYEQLVKKCVQDEHIDFSKLHMIDFIQLVMSLRSKSKGEVIDMKKKKCTKCTKSYDFQMELDEALVYENEDVLKKVININDELSFELMPLHYLFLHHIAGLDGKKTNEMEYFIALASFSTSKLIYKNDIYPVKDFEELSNNVVGRLTEKQLADLFKETQNMMTMKMIIESVCPHCGKKHKVEEKHDFLSFLG